MNNISKEIVFFDLILTVFFETRLSCVFAIQSSCQQPRHGTSGNESYREMTRLYDFRSKLRLNTWKMIFPPGALEMLFKETFLDPNVAVSPEKHFFSNWSRKPGKYYPGLPKLNIQTFAPVFLGRKF